MTTYAPARATMITKKLPAPKKLALAVTLLIGVVFTQNVPATIIGLLFFYGIWFAIVSIIVPRSRYVGGIVLIIYSLPLLGIAFIATWFGIYGVLVLLQGNFLAITGASKINA